MDKNMFCLGITSTLFLSQKQREGHFLEVVFDSSTLLEETDVLKISLPDPGDLILLPTDSFVVYEKYRLMIYNGYKKITFTEDQQAITVPRILEIEDGVIVPSKMAYLTLPKEIKFKRPSLVLVCGAV
jgi:hypothetical protein